MVPLHLRLVIGQHAALDGVAGVQQQAVGELLARLADQRDGAFEAQGGIGFLLVVVVAEDVRMQVGGFQHRHVGTQAIRQRLGARPLGRVWLAGASGQEKGGGEGGEAEAVGHGQSGAVNG